METRNRMADYISKMLIKHRSQMAETWIDPPNYFSRMVRNSLSWRPGVFTVGLCQTFFHL